MNLEKNTRNENRDKKEISKDRKFKNRENIKIRNNKLKKMNITKK